MKLNDFVNKQQTSWMIETYIAIMRFKSTNQFLAYFHYQANKHFSTEKIVFLGGLPHGCTNEEI